MEWEHIIEQHSSIVWRTVNRLIPETTDAADCFQRTIELRMGESWIMTFKEMNWNPAIDPSLLSMEIPGGYAEQPEEAFRKLLRPDADAEKHLTPTEAFRKWQGGK